MLYIYKVPTQTMKASKITVLLVDFLLTVPLVEDKANILQPAAEGVKQHLPD